jgi:hypothetical protein
MAMNGINLVYATTGMEYIFSQVRVFAWNKLIKGYFLFVTNLGISSNGFYSS